MFVLAYTTIIFDMKRKISLLLLLLAQVVLGDISDYHSSNPDQINGKERLLLMSNSSDVFEHGGIRSRLDVQKLNE